MKTISLYSYICVGCVISCHSSMILACICFRGFIVELIHRGTRLDSEWAVLWLKSCHAG